MENNNLYSQIYNMSNLLLAWRKARKGKTKKSYVIEFEKDVIGNLFKLHEELKNQDYSPKPLVTFILRDPKTRKISKSDFRDRIVHHSLIQIIEPILGRGFIYDSCANRIGKGSLFALKRLDYFKRKVTKNNNLLCFILKADIRHYFQEINHEILLKMIKRKINDKKVMKLIKKILPNCRGTNGIGMPLGNLTSQFFANVYLNELDYFVKHNLKIKYYIRYVDDFLILHNSKGQLEIWKQEINKFLKENLRIELHSDKSRVVSLSRGIDFIGFRNFYYFRLLRKRNIKNMFSKIKRYEDEQISNKELLESFQGWNAYAQWANSFRLIKKVTKRIYKPLIPY